MYISKKFFTLNFKNRLNNIFALLYIFVIIILFYYRFNTDLKINSLTLRKYIVNHHIKDVTVGPGRSYIKQTRYVLFWTKFWNNSSWYLENDDAGIEMLKAVNCPVTNCFFTHNKTFLPSVKQFDAILFHGAEYLNDEMPSERANNQLYVFANLESPFLTRENLTRYPYFFNATMTYRFDSDIPWFYGGIIDKSSNDYSAPSTNPKWRVTESDFFDEKMFKTITKKSKKIAWFVSNCNSTSKREAIVKNLKKFFKIDIFRKCGKLKCQKSSSKCLDMLTSNYMFYLSFENSLCKDYVTEKLYEPLSKYIIPIVFNGANTSLYTPPKSYVDVNDFNTVNDLAKYLNFLMNSPKEYIKYFWWRKYYKVQLNPPSFQRGFCDLCMKLNNLNFKERNHVYPDINKWWRDDSCSNKPKIKFSLRF